jgi:hypothetical protein
VTRRTVRGSITDGLFLSVTGGSGSNFGQSVPSSRTVRPDIADGPPDAFQIAYVL